MKTAFILQRCSYNYWFERWREEGYKDLLWDFEDKWEYCDSEYKQELQRGVFYGYVDVYCNGTYATNTIDSFKLIDDDHLSNDDEIAVLINTDRLHEEIGKFFSYRKCNILKEVDDAGYFLKLQNSQ
jgi:hypothetical protein